MKNLIYFLCIISLIACGKSKKEIEKENKGKGLLNKEEIIKTIKDKFIMKYNPIHDFDTIDFDYTYEWKSFFMNSKNKEIVLINGEIDDLDISDDSIYHFSMSQYSNRQLTFITTCTKDQFMDLYRNKKSEGVFIVKLTSVDKVRFNISDLLIYDTLVDYKMIPEE